MPEETEFPPTFSGPGATMFGTYFPKHYVVAVIHDPERAAKAAEELRGSGFAEGDVEVWPGERVLANHHAYLERHGLRHRLGQLFPGDEDEALKEYLGEAERGAHLVTVLAPDPEPRGRAASVLKAHGGHATRYYGDHTFTDL
jgi:hypothetical protein